MFISVQYFSDSRQNYTYICKRSIKVGDFVVVPVRNGKTVAKVTGVKIPTPSFECKEIVKRVRL